MTFCLNLFCHSGSKLPWIKIFHPEVFKVALHWLKKMSKNDVQKCVFLTPVGPGCLPYVSPVPPKCFPGATPVPPWSQWFKMPRSLRSPRTELKNGICKSLTRKLSYNSFFSAWFTDFENIIFEKIHSASSEVVEAKRSFLRWLRPNFGFHLVLQVFT